MYTLPLLLALWAQPAPEPLSYFLQHRTDRCWVLDRSDRKIVSVAANGFGMAAWAILARDGIIARDQALRWVNTCLDETARANRGNGGWCYHFTDLDGTPAYTKQVSSIDTALYYLGARTAADILGDPALQRRVADLIARVDRKLMMPGGKCFNHGFVWQTGKPVYSDWNWDEYSEGVLIYRLFGVPYDRKPTRYDLPLFVYYYPLAFYPRDKEFLDYLGKALDWQLGKFGAAGFTACDGPEGYQVMERLDVVSPLALSSCAGFYPCKVAPLLKQFPDPLAPARTRTGSWIARERIAIDDGAYVLIRYRR